MARLALTQRRLEIETPEAVAVRYPLASFGSRGLAAIIDISLIALLITAELLLGSLVLYFLSDLVPEIAQFIAAWVFAFVIAFAFVTYWGYYLFGEVVRNGRTLGKRWMRVRVIRDDGSRVGVLDSVIRNVVRLIDILPGMYAVGIVAMTFSPNARRLGDMAAGTVVVQEPDRREMTSTPVFNDERIDMVRDYLRRREDMTPEARYQVAWNLLAMYDEEPGQWDEPTIAGRLVDLADLRGESYG